MSGSVVSMMQRVQVVTARSVGQKDQPLTTTASTRRKHYFSVQDCGKLDLGWVSDQHGPVGALKHKHSAGGDRRGATLLRRQAEIGDRARPTGGDDGNTDRRGDFRDEFDIIALHGAIAIDRSEEYLAGTKILNLPRVEHRLKSCRL